MEGRSRRLVIRCNGRLPMRFFPQTREVLDGSQTAREPQDDIDGHQPSKLQPGKRCAVDAKPQGLPDNHVCIGWLLTAETAVKEVDDRQKGARERHQHQNEKSPARPDVRKCIIDKEIESTPSKDHERERCETEWFESELFIH